MMSPTPVVNAAEMREMDRLTIEDAGIAALVLMESAGRAVAEATRDVWEQIGDGPICVVSGKGNNGGDGFVAARYLHNWGLDVTCLLAASRDQVTGDALTQLDIVDTLGIEVVEVTAEIDGHADLALSSAVVIVDALLGTGIRKTVGGTIAELIDRINDEEVPVVSVDLPSGICADRGGVRGVAVFADVTVTFGLPKRGITVHPGCRYAGEIVVADIGIPADVIDHVGPMASLDDDLEAPFLPMRHPNGHKAHFGRLLVVGGTPGKAGAALLAGMGAMRAGAGLVTVATDPRCQPTLEGRYPELMVDAGWTDDGDLSALAELVETAHVIIVGPGLRVDELGREVVRTVLAAEDTPVVLDAGALTVLAEWPELWDEATALPIITPHPGEAGRLLGLQSADVQGDRFGALAALVDRSGGIVVLKGARTLVGAPDGRIGINRSGGPALASAGTGDVLAGIIGTFLARDSDPFDAVRAAVHVHGLAGDRVAETVGEDGLIASDLLLAIPAVMRPTE